MIWCAMDLRNELQFSQQANIMTIFFNITHIFHVVGNISLGLLLLTVNALTDYYSMHNNTQGAFF